MTQRRLVLIRHAKATPGGSPDISRPLAPRGMADAHAIGRWLAGSGLTVDHAVVSPAQRTRQTWEAVAAELPQPPVPEVDDRIYANTVEDLIEVIRAADADTGTLLLVGHNPSVQGLAVLLDDGRGKARARTALRDRYPTSGVSVFDLAGPWPRAGRRTATLVHFEVPRGSTPPGG